MRKENNFGNRKTRIVQVSQSKEMKIHKNNFSICCIWGRSWRNSLLDSCFYILILESHLYINFKSIYVVIHWCSFKDGSRTGIWYDLTQGASQLCFWPGAASLTLSLFLFVFVLHFIIFVYLLFVFVSYLCCISLYLCCFGVVFVYLGRSINN